MGMVISQIGLGSVCALLLSGVMGLLTPEAAAEEWEFFAAGTDSYRHYIDVDSIQWDRDDPAIASARFSSNQEGAVYLMTYYCDPTSPSYGTYLLDGYQQPLRIETVVESARSILCLSPCHSFSLPVSSIIPERSTQIANEFWANRRCPTSASGVEGVSQMYR